MSITIDERTGDGSYKDVLAALEYHRLTYGSAVNTAVQIIRDSELYQEAKVGMGERFPDPRKTKEA